MAHSHEEGCVWWGGGITFESLHAGQVSVKALSGPGPCLP